MSHANGPAAHCTYVANHHASHRLLQAQHLDQAERGTTVLPIHLTPTSTPMQPTGPTPHDSGSWSSTVSLLKQVTRRCDDQVAKDRKGQIYCVCHLWRLKLWKTKYIGPTKHNRPNAHPSSRFSWCGCSLFCKNKITRLFPWINSDQKVPVT
jgi:hypothetical protein